MADTVTTTAAYDSTIKCFDMYAFYVYLYLYYTSPTSITKARI